MSATAQLRRRIVASSDKFWRASELPGADSTSAHLLTELVRAGELRHIRKDVYWRGRSTPLGMSPPSTEQIAAELVGKAGVGPAGHSAANKLALSTQIPRRAQVAVPGRAPTGAGAVTFVSRKARTGRRTASLNETEVALLETLDGWDKVIEMPLDQAWRTLRQVLGGSGIRVERLAKAARTESTGARARLAALLEDNGHRDLALSVTPNTRTSKSLMAQLAAVR